ncbi:MAG: glycoside hydrolase family 2 protein [Anaerolineae bacterium]|nr:glycoside hydrolase family 2 protein [Anaerolineae bacterium]
MFIQSLNGSWRLNQTETDTFYAATVPGCVHTDLLAAGAIPDPFYRDNERLQSWIGEADWTYTRTFKVEDALLAYDAVLLRCHGLDTIATLTLNGTEIAKTENMFRTYEFDVKDLLKAGDNTLSIAFRSPMEYARYMDETMGEMAGWVEPMRVNSGAWIRKEPCNYGWDWGPKMPTAGIWRDIELVAYNTARIDDVLILQDHGENVVDLSIKLQAESLANADLSAKVTLSLDGINISETTVDLTGDSAEVKLTVNDPKLWWVNGLGEQPLYDVKVQLFADETLLDTLDKRIGLRVLRLETPEDAWGRAMFFSCNGVPFFAKGANWIPASPYPSVPNREFLDVFVKGAADTNMNMLRLWGGGIYEDDSFYDLCDEYGIAIWHDFIFACGVYPSFNDDWMANVRAEAIDNVRRVRHHASLAMWCGNNEIEQGMMDPSWVKSVGWDDYHKLFRDLLGDVVAEYDPQRDYWQASPHSPGNELDPYDQTVGDTHLWSVWHGKEPFEWYRTRQDRFCSEFGFQSFPEPATANEFSAPEDRNITSYVMEHHQRSQIGNGTIIHYMLDWYQLPDGFDNLLWLSQILQGMAMKYAVEHWRRNMPRTMGTLYWQLNDMWPAPSWASIDWRGRWKALNYMARRFYQPLLVSGVEDTGAGTVDIHVTNDTTADVAATVVYAVTDVAGKAITRGEIETVARTINNTHVTTLDLSEQLAEYTARNLLVYLDLMVDGKRVSNNLVLFGRPKHMPFLDPQIDVAISAVDASNYDVTLTAQAPALYVWLSLPDAQFSDNFIDLQADQPVTLRVVTPAAMSVTDLAKKLDVGSLYHTYTTSS